MSFFPQSLHLEAMKPWASGRYYSSRRSPASLSPPPGLKRVPKVYGVHVHPLMPNLVAAATNSGTAILAVTQPHQPLPAVPLPLSTPSQALRDDGAAGLGVAFGSSGGSEITYVTAMGSLVLCVTAGTLPNQVRHNPSYLYVSCTA